MFSEYYKKRCLEFMSKELILVYYIFLIGIFGIYKNIKLSYVQLDNIRKYIFLFYKGGGFVCYFCYCLI